MNAARSVVQAKSATISRGPSLPAARGFGVPRPGGGKPLPRPLQAKMEGAFGHSFSDIRVHLGDLPEAIGANAFARGSDLFFKRTTYDPSSRRGKSLIGHELAHVVQQRQGRVAPTFRVAGLEVNGDRNLEREADLVGKRAAEMEAEGRTKGVPEATPVRREAPGLQAAMASQPSAQNAPVQCNNGNDLEKARRQAEQIQKHGGFKAPLGGSFLQSFGGILGAGIGAAIPKTSARTRFATSVFGGVLGKGLEHVGGAIKEGLPVDKSQFDILREQGFSHEDALKALRFKE